MAKAPANAPANATVEHILEHKQGSGGYLVLARETKHYQCLDDDNRPSCTTRHRSPEAMTRCKKGARTGTRTKAGDLVAVKIKHIGASNGESATLAYPLYEIQEERE